MLTALDYGIYYGAIFCLFSYQLFLIAAEKRHVEIVEFLLEKGASVYSKSKNGTTARDRGIKTLALISNSTINFPFS